jgi:hypothetical protein
MANDIEILFKYESDNIDQVESCVKTYMKHAKYRKYKEIYQVDLNIIKQAIKDCDFKINEYNNNISKCNKKQKGRQYTNIIKTNTDTEILYMLIPLL